MARALGKVSILAQPEGRALHPSPPTPRRRSSSFNPRPARRPGATRVAGIVEAKQGGFQSSPSPKAGRYRGAAAAAASTGSRFNPRPARRPGATCYERARIAAARYVSILAQPEGRALPPLLVSRGDHAHKVSILAQPEGRALRQRGGHRRRLREVSILAQPEGRALPAASSPTTAPPRRVSILAQPEGRALPAAAAPPPARPRRVSILAQPEGRALRSAAAEAAEPEAVSILAQPEGRALPAPATYLKPCGGVFQSSPSPKAGRYSVRLRHVPQPVTFQSSPSPKAGRYSRCAAPRRATTPRFNPRPARRPGATGAFVAVTSFAVLVSILAQPEGRALPA